MSYAPRSDQAELLEEAFEFLKDRLPQNFNPLFCITVGSGLGEIVNSAQILTSVPYREIPGFVVPKVEGHSGELIAAQLEGKPVLFLSGRMHFYEGFSMAQVVFPVRLAARLGAKILLLTSAVGAVRLKLKVGSLVVIEDHVNFMGTSPLRGLHDASFGARFPDMSECYTPRLVALALKLASKNKIAARRGNYFAFSGPSYETPLEIQMAARLGGDVVGMSVVPEAIVAHQMGVQVLAISYVANYAAGISKTKLSHEEVLKSGKATGKKLLLLISKIVQAA